MHKTFASQILNAALETTIKHVLSQNRDKTHAILSSIQQIEKAEEENSNPAKILKSAMFAEKYDEMVIVKDIEVYSLCKHHMLPFFGKCHIAYIPSGHIVGLSKFPRMVDAFSRRLQVQERLTDQIRDCLQETLNPQGVAVCIEAQHLCMQMRGVQKQNSITTTSAFSGSFMDEDITRQEFMSLVKGLTR